MRLGKRKTVCSIVLMAGMPLAMPGCQSSRGVQVVGEDQLVTTYDINIQDWENAADDLSQSLIGAGILGREGRPSVIVFSSFNNATGVSVDRDRLIKKIRVALNRSGTAQVTAVEAVGGVVENEHAESRVDTQNERDQVEDFLRGQESNAPRQPESEYSLSVKLAQRHPTRRPGAAGGLHLSDVADRSPQRVGLVGRRTPHYQARRPRRFGGVVGPGGLPQVSGVPVLTLWLFFTPRPASCRGSGGRR